MEIASELVFDTTPGATTEKFENGRSQYDA